MVTANSPSTNNKIWLPYYGWMMVLLAALAMAATLPGRTHGLSMITEPLLAAFELNKTEFAEMNLWATWLGAAFCLPCGWLIDRVGLRSVVACVLLALSASVLWLSQTTDSNSLFLAILLTRGFGQSMLSVVSIAMVGKWFQRRIGPAMGLYSVLMALMMGTGFQAMGNQIAALGWREAWLWLAAGLAIIVPFFLLLTGNRPRNRALEFPVDQTEGETTLGATLSQALLTPCFWVFGLSISFFGMISSGLGLFNQSILAERGFPAEVFYTMLAIGPLAGMLSNLGTGWLARYVPLQRLLGAALLMLAGSLACFPLLVSEAQVYAYGVTMGLAGGMLSVLFFAIWGHAYGTPHLGRIQAAAQLLTVVASPLGPLIVAQSQAFTGSYTSVFQYSAALCFGFAVLAWFTPVPSVQAGAWRQELLVST